MPESRQKTWRSRQAGGGKRAVGGTDRWGRGGGGYYAERGKCRGRRGSVRKTVLTELLRSAARPRPRPCTSTCNQASRHASASESRMHSHARTSARVRTIARTRSNGRRYTYITARTRTHAHTHVRAVMQGRLALTLSSTRAPVFVNKRYCAQSRMEVTIEATVRLYRWPPAISSIAPNSHPPLTLTCWRGPYAAPLPTGSSRPPSPQLPATPPVPCMPDGPWRPPHFVRSGRSLRQRRVAFPAPGARPRRGLPPLSPCAGTKSTPIFGHVQVGALAASSI
jgi:hypothetical protein